MRDPHRYDALARLQERKAALFAITAMPTALAIVKPVIDCAQVASIDLTDIGGARSAIASAAVTTTTINGNNIACAR